MGLATKAGSFALNATTGNQSITGLGFQPKAIIFFGNNLTSDTNAANATFLLGFATSPTSRATQGIVGFNGSTPNTDASKGISGTKCLSMNNSSDTVILDADLVSMDADGFTINITTTNGTAYILNYLALGGTDLTNATVLGFDTKTSAGNQAYTGAGFQPDALFLMSSSASTTPASSNSGLLGIGFGTGATARAANSIRIGAAVVLQINEKTQLTNKILNETSGGATFLSADLVSLDADGFTLNYTTASATARKSWALCLKGGKYKVGSFNQATSTGNQATTGVGFQPTGLLLTSQNAATSASIISDNKLSVGAATSSSARFALWEGDQNGVIPQVSHSDLSRTAVMRMMSHGATPTLDAAADFVSLDSDGFTLNWGTADATAREILYLAFGSSASVATTFTFTGPASGNVNAASTNFIVTPNGSYTGTIIITPTGTGSTGLSPTVLTFAGSSPQAFTITPTVTGSITLTPTNNGSISNPANLTYTVNAAAASSFNIFGDEGFVS